MKLGEQGKYDIYDKISPDLLVPIDRSIARVANAINPLIGFDVWNCYEFSTVDKNWFPIVGVLKIVYNANSPFMVESKSLKLYLNSWNLVRNEYKGDDLVFHIEDTIAQELTLLLKTNVQVSLHLEESIVAKPIVGKMFYTNLLRSNCRVTNQPDWADLYIKFPDYMSYLEKTAEEHYVFSLREENHFHEECCELIFQNILNDIQPSPTMKMEVFVACLYTRRGGIDINPVRASSEDLLFNHASNLITPQFLTQKSIRH